MASDTFDTRGLTDLRSSESQTLLDEIDSLRGKESANFGKSSVLEAISGVPFPRNDTLCTRFATEVILREANTSSATVSIVPSQEDSPQRNQEDLQEFKKTLSGLDELPAVIDEAKSLMGISATTAFSKDILRVEITGPNKPKLTVVDLPGLIHSDSKQQSEADVELISNLVQSYMENPRSIILAVVSAKNDYANQIILKRAKKADPRGLRTLGLITKPDTLPVGSGSEQEFIELASNTNIEFRLGWHVVKNRDFESRNASTEERDRSEEEFFSKGAWKNLPRHMVGISALRQRLSKILLDQIKTHLPNLIKDILKNIDDCEKKLEELGDNRATLDEQRQFLLKLSQSFERLCKAAIDGNYEDPFFGNPLADAQYHKRLRAVVQNQNFKFAEVMRISGHHRAIYGRHENSPAITEDQIVMRRSQAIQWARLILERSRGRELPGSFNPLLVGELFQDQSCLWEKIARQLVEDIGEAVKEFLDRVLRTLADDEILHSLFANWINRNVNERFERANRSLNQLLAERAKHPITYNHYYTETLQNMRQEQQTTDLKDKIRNFMEKNDERVIYEDDILSLAKSLSMQREINMDDFACSELLDSMQAYYKVALKTFIDNVTTQVVERDLIGDLWTIFTPTDVGKMPAQLISEIAAESDEAVGRRQQLGRKLHTLRKGLEICRRHETHITLKVDENEGNDISFAEHALNGNYVGSTSSNPEAEAGGFEWDETASERVEEGEPASEHEPEPEPEREREPEREPESEPEPAAELEPKDDWFYTPLVKDKKGKKGKKTKKTTSTSFSGGWEI